ncbi:MAG: exodeoxyribonuclease V subunit beta [Mariprofundaceae bacterium]
MMPLNILDAKATLNMNLKGIKLIEASAGTGKTYAIGNLYLRMLFEGYLVHQILVVTFTNAATEELRGRIRLRIYEALMQLEQTNSADEFLDLWADSVQDQASEKTKLINQLKLALNSMDEAAIYTIHGFCQRVLTEHAFNSRQAFDIEMITDDDQIWQAAIKDWWRIQAYAMTSTDLLLFSQSLSGLDELMSLQRPLRKPRVKLVPEPADSLGQIFEQWHQLEKNCAELAALWQQDKPVLETALYSDALMRRKKIYKLPNLPQLIADLDAYFESDQLLNIADTLVAVGISSLQGQLKKAKQEPKFEHEFFSLADSIVMQAKHLSQQCRLRILVDADAYAKTRVHAVKQQAGQLSFDDQLILLEQALADNDELGIQIYDKFPVAMIDEFQDTDGIQYDIFKHIYHDREDACLMMIGDPKQAIYSFRGGDIFTYIEAKNDASEHYTLDTNWRSTPELIDALNQLFQHRSEAFIYEDIPFLPVHAAAKEHRSLAQNGEPVAAISLWHISLSSKGKALSKAAANLLMHAHTANEIAGLLQTGEQADFKLDGENVKPSDIAVLVRDRVEAAGLKEALSLRGISAVSSGHDKVFKSEEAQGLKVLLTAIIECKDTGLLRGAMASGLLNYSYQHIYQTCHDEKQWLRWLDHFQCLHVTWLTKGFMPMFQMMLRLLDIGQCLAIQNDAARRLTNLLHLGELIQQASQSMSGMDALLHWFDLELETDTTEAEMRLEHDGDLVRIVTIHSSKGLEYPIVFLPYLWSCKPRQAGKGLLAFFDEKAHQHCLAIEASEAELMQAEKERLAEDIRLAYVALTRACVKVYMAWGQAGNAEKTAMGWLLHSQQAAADLDHCSINAFAPSMDMHQDLLELSQSANIEVIEIDEALPDVHSLIALESSIPVCKASVFKGEISTDWRISSFSNMTHDVHQSLSMLDRVSSDDAIFQFPAGSQVGLFLHALLEQLNFQGDIPLAVADFIEKEAARYGLDQICSKTLKGWMFDVLHTPLNKAGLKLVDIHANKRLNELEFDFSVAKVDINLLNNTLDEAAGQDLQRLQLSQFRGFINGIIDLVFEYDGCYYLADYKSNLLGFSLSAYTPEKLRQAVFDRRYDLQCFIYSLALHRYLKNRIADYDYNRHFGGAYYLFLRGMRAESGPAYGVYFERPSLEFIEKLDDEIFNGQVNV